MTKNELIMKYGYRPEVDYCQLESDLNESRTKGRIDKVREILKSVGGYLPLAMFVAYQTDRKNGKRGRKGLLPILNVVNEK